jgi:hypothetical protein
MSCESASWAGMGCKEDRSRAWDGIKNQRVGKCRVSSNQAPDSPAMVTRTDRVKLSILPVIATYSVT